MQVVAGSQLSWMHCSMRVMMATYYCGLDWLRLDGRLVLFSPKLATRRKPNLSSRYCQDALQLDQRLAAPMALQERKQKKSSCRVASFASGAGLRMFSSDSTDANCDWSSRTSRPDRSNIMRFSAQAHKEALNPSS